MKTLNLFLILSILSFSVHSKESSLCKWHVESPLKQMITGQVTAAQNLLSEAEFGFRKFMETTFLANGGPDCSMLPLIRDSIIKAETLIHSSTNHPGQDNKVMSVTLHKLALGNSRLKTLEHDISFAYKDCQEDSNYSFSELESRLNQSFTELNSEISTGMKEIFNSDVIVNQKSSGTFCRRLLEKSCEPRPSSSDSDDTNLGALVDQIDDGLFKHQASSEI